MHERKKKKKEKKGKKGKEKMNIQKHR